ncbi:hypothetical protein [Mesorhizobium sp. KR9-304]|jgi:hypothetical protein
MKKTYAKPILVRRERMSSVTAFAVALSEQLNGDNGGAQTD